MAATVTDASVEADGDDLVVRWTLAGGESAVDVSMGPTPEAVDHRHAMTVGGDRHEARLARPAGGGRPYVSVAPHGGGGAVVVAERRVPFGAVTNFRDLGGYPATGGRTRWGRVFRSDGLHRLTPAEMATYQALGLRAVYDLRGDLERERHPDPFDTTHLPLSAALPERPPATDVDGPHDAVSGERRLRDMYVGLLAHAGPLFGRLLGGLAEPGGLPAVFHCTGGKDRTGMTAALLLELVGVEREHVLDDYALTSRFRRREHQAESYQSLLDMGMPPEAAVGVLGAPRWAMAEALDELDDAYGGIDAYLLGPADMAAATLSRLRDLLVE